MCCAMALQADWEVCQCQQMLCVVLHASVKAMEERSNKDDTIQDET